MKSYVSMEQKICPVTGTVFETDAILLDKKLKAVHDKYTITGMQIKPEVEKMIKDGYLPIVEIDPDKSDMDNLNPNTAYKTGNVAYLRREVAEELLGIKDAPQFVYGDAGLFERLSAMQAQEITEEDNE